MTKFEKLVLSGLWLILKSTLAARSVASGTAEISWAREVSEAIEDDSLRNI